MTVKEIKAPVRTEMETFEWKFKESMSSQTPLLDKITHYIIKRKGKQMRPLFVFLTAKVFGEVKESTYTAASLIELLHTATLVHDDVVDDSFERRGFFSINAIWRNKIAVLVGDYLLSKGLMMSVDKGEFELLRIITNAVREMSEGELLQIEKARKLDITEDVYFDVIRQKTASLLAACCACGAHSASENPEDAKKMLLFGEKVGIAFQIKDDLFDYGSGENIGKPTGIDIKERKMTLPLIYTLNNVDKSTKKKLIRTVKKYNEDNQKVDELIQVVIKTGGIDYATKRMNQYRDEALEILASFPQNEATKSLEGLVRYTTERIK
jgi:octaprenyl-diphosphate synthase